MHCTDHQLKNKIMDDVRWASSFIRNCMMTKLRYILMSLASRMTSKDFYFISITLQVIPIPLHLNNFLSSSLLQWKYISHRAKQFLMWILIVREYLNQVNYPLQLVELRSIIIWQSVTFAKNRILWKTILPFKGWSLMLLSSR